MDQKPETVYQETVYEQIVVVETKQNQMFGVFDYDLHVPFESVGETLELDVSLLPGSKRINTIDEPRKEIIPNEEDPRDFGNHEFYGEICSLEEDRDETYVIEVDVGSGTVIVYPFKQQNQHLDLGDTVYIKASRTDVAGVRNEEV